MAAPQCVPSHLQYITHSSAGDLPTPPPSSIGNSYGLDSKFPPLTPLTSSPPSPPESLDSFTVEFEYPTIFGTHAIPFKPYIAEKQGEPGLDYFQTIVCQEPYTNASTEELRLFDYCNDRQIGGPRSSFAFPDYQTMAKNIPQSRVDIDQEFATYIEKLSIHGQATIESSGWEEELNTTPLFKWPAHVSTPAQQLLGLSSTSMSSTDEMIRPRFGQYSVIGNDQSSTELRDDERAVFLNTNAPWSTFIVGSQGSGKSYTLSCMLESCLMTSPKIGKTPKPMAAIVFAYDAHSSGGAAETACLASDLPVTVLVSPSNYPAMKKLYESLPGAGNRINVLPLFLDQRDLNTQRMLKLMAFNGSDGPVPLYMEVLISILKDMAMEPPTAAGFDYQRFLSQVRDQRFDAGQKGPMTLRLNLLDSFMNTGGLAKKFLEKDKLSRTDLFKAAPGHLTVVDLTDPFVDPASACVLFDICLALFLEDRSGIGKVVALDEAHKFMGEGGPSEAFTQSLLTVIREQRHKGARVIIATQEPTISPKLLDLCSMTFVHRFTSPDWLSMLQKHLAGASKYGQDAETTQESIQALFHEIVNLNVGESLLFSPAAMLDIVQGVPQKLGMAHIRFKTRQRLTADGGRSIMAT